MEFRLFQWLKKEVYCLLMLCLTNRGRWQFSCWSRLGSHTRWRGASHRPSRAEMPRSRQWVILFGQKSDVSATVRRSLPSIVDRSIFGFLPQSVQNIVLKSNLTWYSVQFQKNHVEPIDAAVVHSWVRFVNSWRAYNVGHGQAILRTSIVDNAQIFGFLPQSVQNIVLKGNHTGSD